MAGLLPRSGEISYNGFVFSASCETTGFDIVPVFDEAGRTVIYNRFLITVRDIITGLPTDSRVTWARRVLTKNGGVFAYVNRGFGPIIINTGTMRDVNYGPKCQVLTLKPVGGRNATEITWQVEVCIPDCASARFAFAPMEFNFKLAFDIDDDGLTTRTYSGFIRIPMTRNGPEDRFLSDSVDNYRERVVPPALPNFRRRPGRFDISADKRRLDFSVVDSEFFGPAPPFGCTDWDASHTVSSSEAGLVKWVGNMNATYNVAPGFSKAVAVNHFLNLIKDRIEFSARAIGASPRSYIPLSLSLGEPSLTGPRNTAFSFSYTFVTTLDKLLAGSGLWLKTRGNDWRTWAYSMNGVLGPRGLAGLRFTVPEDRLVDLCDPGGYLSPASPPREIRELIGFSELTAGNCPPAAESWLAYENELFVEADDGVSPVRLLPKEPIKKPFLAQLVRGGVNPVGRPNANGFPPANAVVPLWNNVFKGAGVLEPDIQQRTAPMVYVYLVGRAMRACYQIPIPELESDPRAGFEPVKANRLDRGEGFTQGIKFNSGLPVYNATWRMRYAVERHAVDKLPVPLNPFAARRGR